jgi:hypothetical protein
LPIPRLPSFERQAQLVEPAADVLKGTLRVLVTFLTGVDLTVDLYQATKCP